MSNQNDLQYVYMLVNPINQIPFYIGISTSPNHRYEQHLETQQGKMRASIVNYIKQRGHLPYMVVLERKPDRKRAKLSEIFWIELLASRGVPIVNKEVLGGMDAVAFHQSGIREQSKRNKEENRQIKQILKKNSTEEKPKNHGKAWLDDETTSLINSFLDGKDCASLALLHGRTEASILGKLGKVSYENAAVYDRMAALNLLSTQAAYNELGS